MNKHISHEQVTGWVIPVLISVAVGILGWMGININEISKTLAVAVYKIDNHEIRLQKLEGK